MGNNTSNTFEEKPKTKDLDDYTLDELVDYIKDMKPKKLDINDEFQSLTKDVKIENMDLIPISIELYNNIKNIVPIYKRDKSVIRYSNSRKRYVKPEFNPNELINMKSNTIDDIYKIDLDIVIPNPDHRLKVSMITLLEYIESFRSPTIKTDMIGISKKILLSCSNYIKSRLINCYNKILSGNYSSTCCFGKSSYVYKGKGSKKDIKSYRELITIPVVINHFHRILTLRLSDYMNKNNYIDTNIQKGGISGSTNPLFEQIYKVKNIIQDANKNRKSLCILFLDISNAFGNLNRDRLYDILNKYHVDKQLIDYIRYYYGNFRYYAKTVSWSTDLIKWNKGLIQGCPMSPLLFVIAINYILSYLDTKYKSQYGYNINDNTDIMFTAFIDDISIICKDMDSLEDIYNKLKFMLSSIGLPINKSKCGIMKINCKGNTFDNIKLIDTYKYLGEYLSSNGTNTQSFSVFISTLRKKLYSLDRKKLDKLTKLGFFTKCMLPWIQKKMAVMYDLDKNDKIKIISLIKKYLTKWGNESNVRMFIFVADLLLHSKDEVINNANFNNNPEGDDITDEEIKDMMLNDDDHIEFEYSEINKEPNVKIT